MSTSNFQWRHDGLDPNGLVIVISQSGETADSLAALRLAKKKGLKTLGIVNVVGSSIAREADNVFYTLAGPEIAVATTKAYSTQLIAGYCLAVQFALVRGCISQGRYQDLISQLQCLPEQIQKILDDKERIQWFAANWAIPEEFSSVSPEQSRLYVLWWKRRVKKSARSMWIWL